MIDYSKLPLGALKDLKSMIECALIRAEVDEDIDKYKRMHEKLTMIHAEIEKRGREHEN